ncbi:hypothetical protein SAMN05421824_2237 [Hyunsoonleella jejuensis]|uniref:Uncharacterized protein n=1 Tax=Hyunsoonleella jejuensis TaxID=419940 RepID=A0A1H9INP8_9FLAO|nr:hypothetical protein SAMN05421824_2237 [Hyunsoonleella jejuensis]
MTTIQLVILRNYSSSKNNKKNQLSNESIFLFLYFVYKMHLLELFE